MLQTDTEMNTLIVMMIPAPLPLQCGSGATKYQPNPLVPDAINTNTHVQGTTRYTPQYIRKNLCTRENYYQLPPASHHPHTILLNGITYAFAHRI
jgi:hypothetical protein